jgi:hypothetical protein
LTFEPTSYNIEPVAIQENKPGQGPAEPFGVPIPAPTPEVSAKNFPLVPNLNMVVDKYVEMNYEKQALEIYQWETDAHPEIFVKKRREGKKHFEARKNIRAQMAFVQKAMAWHDGEDLASYLGTDSSRVLKKGYCGPMKKEAREDFLKRLRGMFTITSILERYVNDHSRVGSALDRRAAIADVNGFVSDVRLKTIMRGGKFNVAVCITQLTVLQWGESRVNQVQTPRIGLHQDVPNPDDEGTEYPYNEAVEYQDYGTGGTDEEMQTGAPEGIAK